MANLPPGEWIKLESPGAWRAERAPQSKPPFPVLSLTDCSSSQVDLFFPSLFQSPRVLYMHCSEIQNHPRRVLWQMTQKCRRVRTGESRIKPIGVLGVGLVHTPRLWVCPKQMLFPSLLSRLREECVAWLSLFLPHWLTSCFLPHQISTRRRSCSHCLICSCPSFEIHLRPRGPLSSVRSMFGGRQSSKVSLFLAKWKLILKFAKPALSPTP